MTHKPTIFFSHANGFPSPCYQQLFSQLGDEFNISYIEQVGHNPKYPVTDNWDYLIEEVAEAIQQESQKPIIGVGHSLGGVLHYFAAAKYPHLYEKVILLDSPVLGSFKSYAIQFAKKLGIMDRFTPGGASTRNRRRQWSSAEEALKYLKSRELFKSFDETCLLDYIHYGMDPTLKGLTLKYNPEVEYQIFQTFPHNMAQYISGFKIPVFLLHGRMSKVITSYDIRTMRRRLKRFNSRIVPGGHLFPFEYPYEVANVIKDILITHHHKPGENLS